jgi:PncC family amidohydrolase
VENIRQSQQILNRCGIQSIDGSPDESHYAFHGPVENVSSLIAMCISILVRRGQTVSFAESFTGGMLSDLWHGEMDCRRALRGTVAVSGEDASWSIVGISEIFLGNFGCCSREVAAAMANGVRDAFASDFSLAIAGNNFDGRGVRSAYLVIRTPTREVVQSLNFDANHASGRTLMRETACYASCKILLQVLFEETA